MRPALLGPGVAWAPPARLARGSEAITEQRVHSENHGLVSAIRCHHPNAVGAGLRTAWAGGARVNGTREPGVPTTPHECLSTRAAQRRMDAGSVRDPMPHVKRILL
ncbi:hypothetical protein E2562_032140 [Oryza meyeriana var. granulata]|uniref:Uncharacterized protein n=1 Tax=Oryza meyeriana var. granulata TaxID=110450 RepID=A0A6G1E5Z9_9ORYZ|nr:hypothetical protein E2562_032140 [Oryza meyeriana var. granulata]